MLPEAIVIHEVLEVSTSASHPQPVVAFTVKLFDPPEEENDSVEGMRPVRVQVVPFWVTVKVLSAIVTSPIRDEVVLLGETVIFTAPLLAVKEERVAVIQGWPVDTVGLLQLLPPDAVTLTWVLPPLLANDLLVGEMV